MYYAMFHRVCEAVVLPLGTDTSGIGFADAFSTLYRLPDHASVENRCKPVGSSTFSSAIKDFAAQLVVMKNKRQAADYDPWAKFDISAVQNDLTIVEKVMSGFDATAPDDQTRFAFLIVRRGRPEQKG